METTAEYGERKRRELAWLESQVRGPIPVPPPGPAPGIVERKLALRARIAAQVLEGHAELGETHFADGRERAYGGWELAYLYQRYDLAVRGPPVYPGLLETADEPCISTTRWVASGMSAVSGVLLAIERLEGAPHAVHALSDTYFETQQVLGDFVRTLAYTAHERAADLRAATRGRSAPGAGRSVVLLDSISEADPSGVVEALDPDGVALVLVDTTCWEATSPRVARVLGAALAARVPVVLLRSHLKLDFLGVEYGRLGSAVIACSPMAPRDRQALYRGLVSHFREIVRVLGIAAVPAHLVPSWGDPTFHDLNRARIARISENNAHCAQAVAQTLGPGGPRVTRYAHGLFFTLDVPGHRDADPETLDTEVLALVDRARSRGLDARRANSFGFDFTALTGFLDARRRARVLRVALADHPANDVHAFSEILSHWASESPGA